MAFRQLSPLQVILAFARLAVRRFLNSLQIALARRKKGLKSSIPERTGTPRKKVGSLILSLFLMGWLGFAFFFIFSGFIQRLAAVSSASDKFDSRIGVSQRVYDGIKKTQDALAKWEKNNRKSAREKGEEEWRNYLKELLTGEFERHPISGKETTDRVEEAIRVLNEQGSSGFRVMKGNDTDFLPNESSWPSGEYQTIFVKSLGIALIFVALSILCMNLGSGNQDLGKVEWSMEWFFTFPVKTRIIFLAKLLEYTVVSPFLWLLTIPLFFCLFWFAKFHFWAIPFAMVCSVYFGILVASLRLLLETWLRQTFPLSRVKNVQAAATVCGSLFYILFYIRNTDAPMRFLTERASSLPVAILCNPFSIPVWMTLGGSTILLCFGGMLVYGTLILYFSLLIAEKMVSKGLIANPSVYQGSRKKSDSSVAAPKIKISKVSFGIVRKELRLLSRDRNFMVQTLFIPLLVFGINFLANSDFKSLFGQNPRLSCGIAFGFGAYVLCFSGVNVLANEGNALWMLYTFPKTLNSILLRKVRLWCGLALIYTFTVLGIAFAFLPFQWSLLLNAFMAVIGVIIYSFISSGIGTLGTDPLEIVVQRRIKPETIYLYMFLMGMYGYAIYSDSIWTKIGQIILSTLLAYALWQKIQDRIPYFLDPIEEAPPSISMADGLIATLAFFVLQGLFFIVFTSALFSPGVSMVSSYVCSGFLVAIFCMYVFWRIKIPDLLVQVGFKRYSTQSALLRSPWIMGIILGAVTSVVGMIYLFLIDKIEYLHHLAEETLKIPDALKQSESPWLLAGLAIIAAPLFEEFVFRGILYKGMRRSLNAPLSILLSAGIFAIVHPPISVIPVFILGLAAAFCVEWTGLIWTSMLVHMIYNSVVTWIQWRG
jgi:ABC-2 type transport system permease protein